MEYLKTRKKDILTMLGAVITMGICVALLWVVDFGTDPYSFMNASIASRLGLSFGNYQLILNLILLGVIVLVDRQQIGLGTLGNMVLVGYAADLTYALCRQVLHIPTTLSLGIRVVIFIPVMILFIISAALYMSCELGTAPYDALAFTIHKYLAKHYPHLSIRVVRTLYDACVCCIGLLAGGKLGLATVFIVLFMGSSVNAFQKWRQHKQKSHQANEQAKNA